MTVRGDGDPGASMAREAASYQRPRFLTRPHGRSLSRSHPVCSAGNVRSWEGTMTVAVTRRELGAGDLRREAKRCRDAAASRRMLALALVLEGSSRGEAARHAGMDRQTLRDWVHRYDAEGRAGLRGRSRPGPD